MNRLIEYILEFNTNLLLVLILFILLAFSVAVGISFILLDKKIDKIMSSPVHTGNKTESTLDPERLLMGRFTING